MGEARHYLHRCESALESLRYNGNAEVYMTCTFFAEASVHGNGRGVSVSKTKLDRRNTRLGAQHHSIRLRVAAQSNEKATAGEALRQLLGHAKLS